MHLISKIKQAFKTWRNHHHFGLTVVHHVIYHIDGAGSKINRKLESQQQPKNKARSKASANYSENQMSAGCTRLQQRKNKEPTTSQRAAEAELN
jgi:hypothetical protein